MDDIDIGVEKIPTEFGKKSAVISRKPVAMNKGKSTIVIDGLIVGGGGQSVNTLGMQSQTRGTIGRQSTTVRTDRTMMIDQTIIRRGASIVREAIIYSLPIYTSLPSVNPAVSQACAEWRTLVSTGTAVQQGQSPGDAQLQPAPTLYIMRAKKTTTI
jgi:hypothetical protein